MKDKQRATREREKESVTCSKSKTEREEKGRTLKKQYKACQRENGRTKGGPSFRNRHGGTNRQKKK